MMKRLFATLLISFCLIGKAVCFPSLVGLVVDDANILSQSQKENLEQVLKQADTCQIVAVSLKSLNGQEIEEYGYQLGRHWGIGRKDINDGVLVIIAPNERQLRIEVGYGLEEILTDAISYQIINKIMLPLAREGKYGEALVEGTDAVLKFINEKNTPVDVSNKTSSVKYGVVFLGIFILLFSIIANIRKFEKKRKSTKDNEDNEIIINDDDMLASIKNRSDFFYNLLWSCGINLALYITGFVVIWDDILVGIGFILIFGSILFALFTNGWKAYRTSPKFPMNEMKKWRCFLSTNSDINSSLTNRRSSGGSSFRGGGGTFGGGGSSGRW